MRPPTPPPEQLRWDPTRVSRLRQIKAAKCTLQAACSSKSSQLVDCVLLLLLLQCVRLRYCTREELYDGFQDEESSHVLQEMYNRYSLLHYLLSCSATAALRSQMSAATTRHPPNLKAATFSPTARPGWLLSSSATFPQT
ncbi:hypothetical protein E2C01_064750 [Portunus trituberculatus]|uniref:Uncharacterized protein n=1 Tax=Portunus trituberculatus TaxID=210409 RepID=A0A5B7HDW2_PORTR|nr:hypothetical protein [Portunus trituberculatus]